MVINILPELGGVNGWMKHLQQYDFEIRYDY